MHLVVYTNNLFNLIIFKTVIYQKNFIYTQHQKQNRYFSYKIYEMFFKSADLQIQARHLTSVLFFKKRKKVFIFRMQNMYVFHTTLIANLI